MEFANHPSAPFIADAGSEQDWARQHVAEQIHMADSKAASGLLPLRRRSAVALKRRASSDVRHRPENGPSGVSKRRRVDRPSNIVNKPLSPADKAKSAGDWEKMLKLSLNNLQGLYAKMGNTSAPATGRLLGDRFPQRVADSDRGLMASRAMHHAAGCCSEGGLDDDEDEDCYSSSSGEDMADWAETDSSSDDQPATPDTAQMDEDSDVDGDLETMHSHTQATS